MPFSDSKACNRLFRSKVARPAAIFFLAIMCGIAVPIVADAKDQSPRKLILAHYMPWYTAKPFSNKWGWHWTMNSFDPDKNVDGRPQIASKLTPLIGPYDSSDPAVLEYQLLTMKAAGIDGVIVDWYGSHELHDYSLMHANTQKLVAVVQKFGMKFAICYEDQIIAAFEKAGRIKSDERVEHARKDLGWLAKNWFPLESYVRLDNKPVLLSFGHSGLTNDEWKQCLSRSTPKISYVSEHHQRPGAAGAFDWPLPKRGAESIQDFYQRSGTQPNSIPVAFPRFVDIYAEANVHPSHGRIDDDGGQLFRESLKSALRSRCKIIQLATWNDWGEGTVIEPSREYGYRDLEAVQKLRREILDSKLSAQPSDLELPAKLLQLRRQNNPSQNEQLDAIAKHLEAGEYVQAAEAITKLTSNH